jgi:hypothetical protein
MVFMFVQRILLAVKYSVRSEQLQTERLARFARKGNLDCRGHLYYGAHLCKYLEVFGYIDRII